MEISWGKEKLRFIEQKRIELYQSRKVFKDIEWNWKECVR